LVLWGAAGTFANLLGGRLIDSAGSRRVIALMLAVLVVDVAFLPWTGVAVWSAAAGIAIWGGAGWGVLVPQQHRLVSLAPESAPVVLGLNTSCTYLGVSAAGMIGAAGIRLVGAHNLGLIAAVLIAVALGVSELATRRIHTSDAAEPLGGMASG
jgi:predicted MFS family arabinose efflux permease